MLAPLDYLFTSYAVSTMGIGGAVAGTLACHIALIAFSLTILARRGIAIIRFTDTAKIVVVNLALFLIGHVIRLSNPTNDSLLAFLINSTIYSVSGLVFATVIIDRALASRAALRIFGGYSWKLS